MTRTLVLGMGNPILSDDRVGLLVAERVRAVAPPHVDVEQSEVAGLRLLELLRGYDKVVILDALKSPAGAGRAPGDIVRFKASEFRGGHRYGSAHSIGLATALELGRRLGYDMPAEVVVLAVEAEDVETFGEELSPAVAAAAERLVAMVLEEVGGA